MRRSVPRLFVIPALISALTLGFSSCGGGGGSTAPTAVTISPTNVSLNRGQVSSVTATATDAKSNAVGGDITWSSDNPKLLSVSTAGALCAGSWDTSFIVCTPATSDGTPSGTPITGVANLTATVKGVAGTIKVFVHDRIDRVVASGPSACASMTETQQFGATAFSNDQAVCSKQTPAATAPCALPAASVGPATWGSTNISVVSLDNTADKAGLATAGIPGRAGVIANLSGVNSPTVSFETCAVQSVQLAIQSSNATSFTIDKPATQTLVATVKDSKGTTLTAAPITFSSSQPFTATTAVQSPVTNALATAVNPGTTNIVASCSPPTCNVGIFPVYSNVITGNVNGTSGGTVYAASTDSVSLVPIDVSTNTPATAVTLPRAPDSFAVNRQGTKGLLGASGGIMILDTTSNAVTNASSGGTVLGFLPDGTKAAIVDTPNKNYTTFILASATFDAGYNTSTAITRVDPVIESASFFGVNGTASYLSLQVGGFNSAALATPALDVAVSGAGSLVYLAGGTAAGIDVRAVCNAAEVDTQVASNPKLIRAIPNGTGAVAVDDASLIVLHDANIGGSCPPTVAESRSAVSLPVAAGFVARQVLVTPDSTKALVSTDKGLVVVNLSTLAATKVTTVGTFTGGVTLDSKTAYFGGDDGTVHRIDLSGTPAEAATIAVNLKKTDNSAAMPNLVVVRNK
jgi:trimeric autotransporter adhesin